jgi:hypothetical protein
VGAVENAFCAFSKELVDAFFASTAPAASTDLVEGTDDRSELGHFVGSAQAGPRRERLPETCTPTK